MIFFKLDLHHHLRLQVEFHETMSDRLFVGHFLTTDSFVLL